MFPAAPVSFLLIALDARVVNVSRHANQQICPSFLPSVPYPPAGEGCGVRSVQPLIGAKKVGSLTQYQSDVADLWKDYYATIYSAEIVQLHHKPVFCLSRIQKGIANCLKYGHDTVFLVAFTSYTCIGVGSFIFHSTLKCKI